MKNLKLLVIAFVAMFGFSSCDNKTEYIYDDHSADIVGTWTCLQEKDTFAEALIIKADGSMLSTGYDGEDFWENVAGKMVLENGNVTMTFEDGDNFKGHFDIIPGKAFSIYNEDGVRLTYNYCENDLSDEVLGMWICHEGLPGVENDMAIKTYSEGGKYILTTKSSIFIPEDLVNAEADYVVVGDLLFMKDASQHLVVRLTYTPNATTLGDIMTETIYAPSENGLVEISTSWLRVKQYLNFDSKAYAYNTAYVTDAKGKDEDFTFAGYTFNMSKIGTGDFDMMFRSDLFCVVLNVNSITHKFRPNGQESEVDIPITVEGNKVTLDMSVVNPACRNVETYMFQDADDSQLHMYMHTDAFINYFANLMIPTLVAEGKLDTTNTAAVEKVFADMEARIESINVSFVFKALK